MPIDNDKNPWGRKPDNKPNPWGSGGGSSGGGGNNNPPDLETLLRQAQERMRQNFPGGFGPGRAVLLIGVAVIGLWLASGFYLVSPSENAVITRFGQWTTTQTNPGLGYRLPWPIESAQIINVTVDQRIQIGFLDTAGRGGTKQDVPEESLMLTSDANIVDLDCVVLWNIGSAKEYLFDVRDQEQTIKKVAESALREVVGQTELQPIITGNRNDVAMKAQKIMQDTLDNYKSGVSIKQVIIQDATVHPDVIEAYEDVVAATQDAERFQNEANIYRNDIVPKARGDAVTLTQAAAAYKESIVAKAQGEAARFNAIYAGYIDGKDVTRHRLYIETMEEVMGKAQKIIVDRSASGGVVPYLPLNELKPAAGGSSQAAEPASPVITVPARSALDFGQHKQ
jgi:membrane protease subunit HflK